MPQGSVFKNMQPAGGTVPDFFTHSQSEVEDADFGQSHTLYFVHYHGGRDLQLEYAERALGYVNQLWGREVALDSKKDWAWPNPSSAFGFGPQRPERSLEGETGCREQSLKERFDLRVRSTRNRPQSRGSK
jgi:hypothetical protein